MITAFLYYLATRLRLGILTSIFSAVVVSRGIVNLIYGGRKKVKKLSIGDTSWHRDHDDNPKKVGV